MQESGVVPELAVLLESGAMSESGMAPRFMTMLESRAIPKSRVTLLKSGMTPELVVPTEFGMPPGFSMGISFEHTHAGIREREAPTPYWWNPPKISMA